MDRYLGGEEIDRDLLIDDLETRVARGSFHPVLPGRLADAVGLDGAARPDRRRLPVPARAPDARRCSPPEGKPGRRSPATPTARWWPRSSRPPRTRTSAGSPWCGSSPARCARTHRARVRALLAFFGTARPQGTHEDHDEDERIGACTSRSASTSARSTAVVAGDICAIAKLTRAETGDTLSDKDHPLLLEPWSMPEPLLPLAIEARAKADEDKLGAGLQRLVAEDPTLRMEHNPETHQIVLWCMGEAHADVVLDRLENRYGVGVDQVELRVPLRETFAARRRARAGTSSSPAGTGSTPSATSRSSRCPGRRLRVRRQGRRRRRAAPVHPVGGEGRPRPDGEGRAPPATRWSTSGSR